jgi:AcrR family transcriptional regulator
MGRPLKGTRPVADPSLTDDFWLELTGVPEPAQRDQFLWLSIDLVRKLGLSQFTVTTVARRLGYSVAMINHHFGSRDGLIAEGASRVHDQYSDRVMIATERAAANPRARLEANIRARFVEGRKLGGWAQVLNFPFHSFESPHIAMERVGRSFDSSFYRNLAYLTQLVIDYQRGEISTSIPEVASFPSNVLATNSTAFHHASMIGTASAGAVMWLTGRLDVREQTADFVKLTDSMLEWQIETLLAAIPIDMKP